MFFENLKSSIRNLVKNKVFSALGIIGFSAGFSVCIIIGMYVYNELTVDGSYSNKNRIFRLVDAKNKNCSLDYNLKDKIENDYPGVEIDCPVEISHESIPYPVVYNNKTVYVDGLISTTNEFFEVFSIQPIIQNAEKPFKDINSAVITETGSKLLFGDDNPLGKTINVNLNAYENDLSVISAVIPDFPSTSSIQGKIIRNSENKNFRMSNTALIKGGKVTTYTSTNHYLLLGKNQNPVDLEKRLNTSIGKYETVVDSIFLQPLKSIYFDTSLRDRNKHGSIGLIRIISIIGFMILLLSIVNNINYIISSQLKKHKEIGIKKTIGAKLSHLLGNYATDILLWIVISLIISLFIVIATLPYFNSVFQANLNLRELLDIRFILVGLSIILFIVLSSLLPYVFMLSKFQILNFLKGNLVKTSKTQAGSILTIFQLTISILLISGLFIVQKQISYLKVHDLGFNSNETLKISLPVLENNYESVKNELLKNPSIEMAALSSAGPGDDSFYPVKQKNWKHTYNVTDIDENFISTMGIELIEGRNFLPSDSSNNYCIVNEAYVAAMAVDSADLSMLMVGEVIGVVKDFNFESLHQSIQPVVMMFGTGRSLSLRISTANLPAVMDYINNVWNDFYPNESMEYKFYDSWFESMYRKEEQISQAGIIFSIIAIIITCLGLLGKIIQVTLMRTKEIGIRKVNGAKVIEILSMLNQDFIKWVAVAFIIATPLAYYAMHKWLQNFAFKTELSWWVFAIAGVLTLGITLLTVSWQSWRAATRNPVESLRYE